MEPMQKPKLTPKDFFLYLGAMVTLYWSAGAFIALLFRIIDTTFRDELNYYVDPYSSGIRFAIASLIVVFPTCLMLFMSVKKDAVAHPEKFALPLRRWLYALTAFVTALALVGDIIALINGFLGGELTSRFLFKVLSVLVVAGAVFSYCLLEIRVKPEAPRAARRDFLWGAALVVLASIVYGFVVMGSPLTIRKLRFDERRISDLQSIQNQLVYSHWTQKGKLPDTLNELSDPLTGFRLPVDPQTGKLYEYRATGARSFELCATFDAAAVSSSLVPPRGAAPVGYNEPIVGADNWRHGEGRACFDRTIDPELFPPKVKPKS